MTTGHRQFPPNAAHLVRTSQQMQLQLSQMADQKASMVLAATSVMLTIIIGQLRAGADMRLTLILLGATAVVAAFFAILAVMPRVTRPADGQIDPGANLLFFGNFSTLPEEEFIERVLQQMEADETSYRTMLRDIHQAGQVLARGKYRYLSYAYKALLSGLAMTLAVALVEMAVRGII